MALESGKGKRNKLLDNVILIINGLCRSGGMLAKMLAQQGADVAIIGFDDAPELALRIQHDVEKNGRRCLVLTPNLMEAALKGFAQQAIKKIIDDLGGLDAFITYSAADSVYSANEGNMLVNGENGRSPKLAIFDQHDLTKAALKEILAR